MPNDGDVFQIGVLARAAGVSAPTIRYYEEIGLIPPATRNLAGQRRFRHADLERLRFIRRCRDFGFGIDDVRRLLALRINPDDDCREVRDIAADHLAQVRSRIQELGQLEQHLSRFVGLCDDACCGGPGNECVPLVELEAQ